MKTCYFCGDENVVLTSGYDMCARCARAATERPVIEAWVQQAFPKIPNESICSTLSSIFGTPDYGFSAFKHLYDLVPRGEWTQQDGFDIDQQTYVVQCFTKYTDGGRALNV